MKYVLITLLLTSQSMASSVYMYGDKAVSKLEAMVILSRDSKAQITKVTKTLVQLSANKSGNPTLKQVKTK